MHPAVDNLRRERDACGIGFLADATGRASRTIVDGLLEGLAGVRHRGAVAADRRTGDGAGLLLPIARALLPAPWCGLAMVFLRDDSARTAIEQACAAEGIGLGDWRPVPVRPGALGDEARATMPRIEQLVLRRPLGTSLDEAERRAYRARRRAEQAGGAYIASLSFRTVTYKALCAADQLAAFYPDLLDPALEVPFGIFHQRFSTNTAPSWERAQPFRLLGHNGEINSIDGNVAWMRSRGHALDLDGSDSALLDNALELLVHGGREIRHAVAMLLPEAADADPELDEDVRAFHRYHATLLEPWDGPAGVVFTDGRVVGATLDRNGLRPLRYAVADDRLVACASEAGALPLPEGVRIRRGRLGPGQMLVVDPALGIEESAAIKGRLARKRPYARWLRASVRPFDTGVPVEPPTEDLTPRQVRVGFTREDILLLLRPSAATGHEPVSSMGDDTALPPLAGRARLVTSYLRQRFAQVTNPPIDHLRERSVMSLRTLLGARAPLEGEHPRAARLLELDSFFLFPSAIGELRATTLDATFDEREGLRAACSRLADEAEASAAGILVLDDGGGKVPVPPVLGVGAVHQRLVRAGMRTTTSIVVVSDEPREAHDMACLLGHGADAVCPRLTLETVASLAAAGKVGGDHPSPAEAQLRYREAIEDGVLKIMSKMGIAELASYRGAQLFEALGLARDVVDTCLTGTPSVIGGVGFAELEREAVARCRAQALENPGYVKFRKGGERHATSPPVVESLHRAAHALRRAVNGAGWDTYERFAELVNGRTPLELRDLLELAPSGPAVALDDVEPVESIVRRFSSGGMSHGSLSAEAHETVAIAFNRLHARSNCGEGGEDPARFRTERNSRIKQVASGRFGVTPEYVAFAQELQIKIAQGSKPGEGGQLPGHKVTEEIARLRHTQPGVGLISPPPHHDIYSIEDLAQLVFDLKQANPAAAVSVKLVAEAGVGLVAAGVVKALADIVHIAGADGGTGASPLSSIKHAGVPWELGLAETQRVLVESGLRERVRLRADGGLKTGRDVLVAALLGADEVSFGTALLLAEGCLMVRSCHLDTCPVGIATQRPELRAKFAGTPDAVEAYLLFVAEEIRRLLARLGLRTFADAVGRSDLLRAKEATDRRAASLTLRPVLEPPSGSEPQSPAGFAGEAPLHAEGGELGLRLAENAAPALEEPRIVDLSYPITNRDRAVGARLGVEIARRFSRAAPPGRVRARFEGSAGQSFGAFLSAGVEVELIGEANDGVGKGMGGGRIVVLPPPNDAGDPVLLGNAALYGATGGELFCAGQAGERFAVRNSGAVAVVEGAGDHACEYMTGGAVVVLGEVGLNAAAGMSGGELYVLDPEGRLPLRLNTALVVAEREAGPQLRELLELHLRHTGSPRAGAALERWDDTAGWFWRIVPRRDVAHREAVTEDAEVAAG